MPGGTRYSSGIVPCWLNRRMVLSWITGFEEHYFRVITIIYHKGGQSGQDDLTAMSLFSVCLNPFEIKHAKRHFGV
jgi:hypothetical protein